VTTEHSAQPRTYGHWRLGRSPGLLGLGPVATGFLFVAMMASIVALTSGGLIAALVVALISTLVLGPLSFRVGGGRTGAQSLAAGILWMLGVRRRQHVYYSGITSRVTESHRLPGILARSFVYEVETGRADAFRFLPVVVIPQSRHYTVTLRCEADGTDLVDPEDVDRRVDRLAQWLSKLGRESMLVQAQITVDTAPDPGTRLANEVEDVGSDDAPPLARRVMEEVVATYPAGSATIETRVSLTFAPPPRQKSGRVWDHAAMCREIATRLPGLVDGLSGTGAGAVYPMSTQELTAAIRTAYDPVAASDIARARDARIPWEECGPVSTREAWDHYRHDSGVSVTWAMQEAPRGTVFDSALTRLVAPSPTVTRKRVSIIYRPFPPGRAAKLVESDIRTATFFAQKGKHTTARDSVDVLAAHQAAAEEAQGAGIVRFTLLVTATVLDPAELDDAETVIDSLADEAKVVLRKCYASQAASFAGGLPVGLMLNHHATIPF
jgi:hypothetical protein